MQHFSWVGWNNGNPNLKDFRSDVWIFGHQEICELEQRTTQKKIEQKEKNREKPTCRKHESRNLEKKHGTRFTVFLWFICSSSWIRKAFPLWSNSSSNARIHTWGSFLKSCVSKSSGKPPAVMCAVLQGCQVRNVGSQVMKVVELQTRNSFDWFQLEAPGALIDSEPVQSRRHFNLEEENMHLCCLVCLPSTTLWLFALLVFFRFTMPWSEILLQFVSFKSFNPDQCLCPRGHKRSNYQLFRDSFEEARLNICLK